MNRQQLKTFAHAIRESTNKSLRLFPPGFENWRISANFLSFAEIAKHIIDSDQWLFEKIEEVKLPRILELLKTIINPVR